MSDYQGIGDLLYLETFDGKRLVMDERVKFAVYGNFGAPPVEFITSRGYKQHGLTEVDYLLGERNISIDLIRAHAIDRQAYWDNRLALHEFLRPNRGGPMLIVLETPGGNRRAIYARPNPGLTLPPPGDNAWLIQEALDFRCFDPIWFDPDAVSLTLTGLVGSHLVFPITFPIQFGAGGLNFTTGAITYTGTWAAFPLITLTGPYTSCRIENETTGARIELVVAIASGETRVITLTPGALSIVDGAGVDRFNELSSASDLINFNIRPDPEVANGQQTIVVNMSDGVQGTSDVMIAYNTRYFAI